MSSDLEHSLDLNSFQAGSTSTQDSGQDSGQNSESMTVEQAIANVRQTEDPGSRYYAAWWLGRFRVDQPDAVDALLDALQDDSDRSPDGGFPLRRNAARALGKLGDRRAVDPLIDCLSCEDYYVREAAAQALEDLGDLAAVPALLALLEGGVEDTQPQPGKPHLRQPYDAVLEALGQLKATEAIDPIRPFLEHPLLPIQLSAARAMYQLTQHHQYGDRLVQALRCSDLQLRRSALMDLGAMGYTPAAEAIAQTLAENSLKLISLKGVLEAELQRSDGALTESVVQIMSLMDELL